MLTQEGVRKIVDDSLIYAPTISILKKRSRAFLDQCHQHGVTLKQAKSQLAVTEVDFGGFRLSATGIQTSPDLLKSIKDFSSTKKPHRSSLMVWSGQPAW